MLECSWDDIPLRLFRDRTEAMRWAKDLKPEQAVMLAGYAERQLTEQLQLSIVRFTPGGRASKHFIVKELDEE